jgi:Predicted membrane protein
MVHAMSLLEHMLRNLEMPRSRNERMPTRTWSTLVFSCGAVIYTLVLAALAARTSLWVDEVLQLLGTRDELTITGVLRWVMLNPGGVPLGYLTQRAFIQALGYSVLTARLPSILFTVLACLTVAVMCRQLGLRSGKIAAMLLATSPLVFRYGFEARPYGQALFLSIGTTVIFLWLQKRPNWRRLGVYTAAIAMGLYTQPFSVFTPIAHVVSMLFSRGASKRAVTASVSWTIRTISAVLLGALLFLPWILAAYPHWRTSIATSKYAFCLELSLVSVILREGCGSYIIASLLMVAAVTALRRRNMPRGATLLLIAMTLMPVAGALIADAVAGYFFAARQLLFMLPPLAILASEGISELYKMRTSWGTAMFIGILAASVHQDIRMVHKPREDWRAAAASIHRAIEPNGCVVTAPAEWAPLYEFFEPDLKVHRCGSALGSTETIVLAITPYTTGEDVRRALASIAQAGFENSVAEEAVGSTRLRTFHR